MLCRFHRCNLYLVHPSLSKISLNISSVWSKLPPKVHSTCHKINIWFQNYPFIYKRALQHPYLPILLIIPPFPSTLKKPKKPPHPCKPLKGMTGKCSASPSNIRPAMQVVYHRCFNLGPWLGFGDCCLVIARWFSWVPRQSANGGKLSRCWWMWGWIFWRFDLCILSLLGERGIISSSICFGYVRCIL